MEFLKIIINYSTTFKMLTDSRDNVNVYKWSQISQATHGPDSIKDRILECFQLSRL